MFLGVEVASGIVIAMIDSAAVGDSWSRPGLVELLLLVSSMIMVLKGFPKGFIAPSAPTCSSRDVGGSVCFSRHPSQCQVHRDC